MAMKSESKDKKNKVPSLDDIIFPFLITITILFVLLAAFIMDEELLNKWDKLFGSAVLGW
jgi:hypothetical protein